MKTGVRLFGGFAGTETSIDQRDPNQYETILSGDLKGDDKTNFINYDDNSYHVIVANNIDSSTVLDGVVITGGNANGPGPKRAENSNHHGAGLLGLDYDSMTLIGCTFRYNMAIQNGAGMYVYGGRPVLEKCVFKNNRTSWLGGALFCSHSGTYAIGCTFAKNTSDSGGGGVYLESDSSMFIQCTFAENFAQGGGGGVCCAFSDSKATLTNCRFLENRADYGGGLLISESIGITLNNCLLHKNIAKRGSGVYNGRPDLRSNSPILSNCTIVGNKSPISGSGVGIYSDPNCSLVLVNCIVWNNIDGNSDTSESIQVYGGSPVLNNCCIQGWTGILGGTGNFDSNPLFVDPNGPDGVAGTLDDNLRLDSVSPCRNAGDNSALCPDSADFDKDGDVNEPIPFDIDGKPRILYGVVDLGSYEAD